MLTMIIFVAALGAMAAGLAGYLVARRGGSTENLDGLLAEQARSAQARAARASFSSIAMHSTYGLTTDQLGKYDK
ncbi:hypothetical protein GCM10010495_33130 [Kitasatospora herbaricolor]|uniref:hypothetical protein n=1 Tax=Kitasatospora herbaricolor TaxID=68217 RepID=UPI00174D2183|nr:hypothetical protein [Kitasatospora herbaricolor]MDQ0307619.1 hypothetical protein [Kitasatospora herbaricolor]GGV16255.1 hypothetical protein GCM10010495_33130 [Kitasatospora herbaricolor]